LRLRRVIDAIVDSVARGEFVPRVEQRSYALVFALHSFVVVFSR